MSSRMKPIIVVGAGPGRSHDGARARLLRPAVPAVRGRRGAFARHQGRHHPDAHARGLPPLWRRRPGAGQGAARRRDRRCRARDQYRAAVGADRRCSATRPAIPSSSTCRSITSSRSCSEAIERAQAGRVHLRHRLTSFRQSDDGVVASFETPDGTARGRRLVSARLRRRAQHGALAARRCGRRRVARTCDACWST